MKTALAASIFAIASFPLLGQQMPAANPSDQPNNPATQQSAPPGTQTPGAQPSTPASTPETPASSSAADASATTAPTPAAKVPAADMRPVNGKLVNKLDSSTAKTGDDVVLQTESSVKTADGTEIPKGSKLIGHVLAVKPAAGQNSQVVLRFDRAELKDGKNLTIQSEIESVAPAMGSESASTADAMPNRDASPMGNAPSQPGSGAGMNGATANPGYGQQGAAGTNSPGAPAAGTIVSRNGNIAIRTRAIPGVLLANNAPGQQDPRMAQASGFLLGARKDVQLDGGTKMTLNVATAGTNGQ
jgi:hypothetical protein